MKKLPFYIFLLLCCNSCQNNYSEPMIQQQLLWNSNMERSTQAIKSSALAQIEQIKKDNEYKTQYHTLYPKFDTILNSADRLYAYIDRLKQGLSAKGNTIINADSLTKNIQDFYQQSIRLMENTWDNGGIKATIFADVHSKAKTIVRLKETLSTPLLDKIRNKPNQLKIHLENKPPEAVLNLLSSIQNDLQRQAYKTFELFAMQIGSMCNIGYSAFDIAIQPNKQPVRLGEMYKANILYGKYAKASVLSAEVDGVDIPIFDNRARYSIQPKQTGEQRFHTKLTFINPKTKKIERLERSFYFEVRH